MHLHSVFVLLYSVCCSVKVLLCVDVIQSFTYVLRVIILDITKKCVRAREKSERRYEWHLVSTIRKQKKNKTETSGCGLFVVAYFQPLLPIPLTVYSINAMWYGKLG